MLGHGEAAVGWTFEDHGLIFLKSIAFAKEIGCEIALHR